MINDRKQSLLIRGQNVEQPILLCCHGGPGMAQIGFIRHFQKELEKHFIVINWDQRGAGKSFYGGTSKQILRLINFFRCTKGYSISSQTL